MRLHFIGHASLLVEADDVTILMDPIFGDPHYEDTAVMSPPRQVEPQKLPPYGVIVISHRHLDHFDIRTLATLNRHCTVLIPHGDSLLESAIRRLGFTTCQALRDGQSVSFGRTTLIPTDSKASVREFGLVVRDSTSTLWNQVDSQIDGATALRIADEHGPIDLLLATWQPLLESEVLTNGTTSFPYSIYFKMLANVQLARPRVAIPHACGFKYAGQGAWLNKFVFPATREMVVRDLATIAPGVTVRIANPGDIVDVAGGSVAHRAAASPFVRMVRDDTADTTFDPTGAVPELSDANPRYDEGDMLRTIESFFTGSMVPALVRSYERRGAVYEYQRLGAVYQLDVVFPSRTRSWSIDFASGMNLNDGPSAAAHLRSRIAASLLVDLITGACGPSRAYAVGGYRWTERVYAVEQHGAYRWKPLSEPAIVDPLWMALDLEALFEKYVDRELAASMQTGGAVSR